MSSQQKSALKLAGVVAMIAVFITIVFLLTPQAIGMH